MKKDEKMRLLAKLSIGVRLMLVGVVAALGLGGYALMSLRTLDHVKVNGPLYAEIVRGKDLVADILPPPEYLIESYLVSFQLVEESDPASRRATGGTLCGASRAITKPGTRTGSRTCPRGRCERKCWFGRTSRRWSSSAC
ncbi:MAG: hypothetical protein QM813_06155 [Verrucomicrobiota bacterium]